MSVTTRSAEGSEGVVYATTTRPGALAEASAFFDGGTPARYEIGGEIATGGMGRILEAWDRRNERRVAIKVLLRPNATALIRFAREAKITARLEHPAIVPLHETGRLASGEPFYAMKLVRGRSLGDAARDVATHKERAALLPHVIALAEALAYAHDKGIVHRDLKPSNVLVGAFGETVVIDWGLAKEVGDPRSGPGSAPGSGRDRPTDDGLTAVGAAVGTPGYMAPEQARGEDVDERADVFAIGMMLRHLFVDAATPSSVRAKQTTSDDEPPPPSPELAADFRAILAKATAADRDDRYPSARELAEDLRRYAEGRRVSAYSYSLRALLARWAARHRITLGVAGALLASLVVLSTFALRRIVHERDRADAERRSAEHEAPSPSSSATPPSTWSSSRSGTCATGSSPSESSTCSGGSAGRSIATIARSTPRAVRPIVPSSRAGPRRSTCWAKVETRRQGAHDLAERLREQQTKIWERIVAAEPRDAEANAELALAVFNQARLLGYGRGRYDDSFALYQRASSIAAKAVELAPEDVRWRIAQAYVESSLAISLSDRSQVDASVAGLDPRYRATR